MTRVAAVQHGTRTLLVETDDGVDLLHVTALPRPAQVEPAAEGPAGFATVNRLDNIAKAMPDVQSLIESASGMVIDAVNKLAGKPDKVALEFGIKF